MTQTVKLVCQTALLSAIYLLCKGIVTFLNLPIPANVLGIVLLFCLLLSGIVKESHLDVAASFLLKHLVFFFVPVAVGLMDWFGVFYDYGVVLLAALLVSFVLPLYVVSAMMRRVEKEDE